jgi:hypothetical protein
MRGGETSMTQHEWIPSENDTRRHCKYCGIYEDYTNVYPQCQPQEKPVLEEASEWKVTSNIIGGVKMYAVYRLIDTQKTDQSGNREFAGTM